MTVTGQGRGRGGDGTEGPRWQVSVAEMSVRNTAGRSQTFVPTVPLGWTICHFTCLVYIFFK